MKEQARRVERGEVATPKGAVGDTSVEDGRILSGAAPTVEAQTASVEHGIAGLVRAETLAVCDSIVLGAHADTAILERSNVVLLAARDVGGQVRVLLDWQAAAAFGAALGLVLGLLLILLDHSQ